MLLHTIGRVIRVLSSAVLQFLGGYAAVADGEPQTNAADHACLNIAGQGGTYLRNASDTALGIVDDWTIMVWVKLDTLTSAGRFYEIGVEGTGNGAANQIFFGTTGSNQLDLLINDSSGTNILYHRWNATQNIGTDFLRVGEWNQFVTTWTGSALTTYVNGFAMPAPTLIVNSTGTMTDSNRRLTVGANRAAAGGSTTRGKLHSFAMWDTALSADQIRGLYNHGDGAGMDLSTSRDGYDASSNLVHWYRLGLDSTDLGKDSKGTLDIDGDAGGSLGANDIAPDAPKGSSIFFDNTGGGVPGDYLRNSTAAALGIADSYTISVWFKFRGQDLTASNSVLDISEATVANSRILLFLDGGTGGDPLTFRASNSSGTALDVDSTFTPAVDVWYHAVLRKEGTTRLSLYINGTEDSFQTVSIPTQTDASREITVGATNSVNAAADCQVASIAIWDEALTASEIKDLYNGGFRNVNLSEDYNNYNSSANLIHWWELGAPAQTGETGTEYWRARVGTKDIGANSSGVSTINVEVHQFGGGGIASDGFSDYFRDSTATTVGIANQWTVGFWARQHTAATAFETIFDLRSGSTGSIVQIGFDGTVANDPLSAALTDTGTTLFKNLDFTDADSDDGIWAYWTLTFDGADTGDPFLGYRNGILSAASGTDNTGTMADSNRGITILNSNLLTSAAGYDVGPFAVWSSVLTADEIRSIHAQGFDAALDADFGNYASSANLVHWWKLGENSDDLGNDYVASGARDLTPTSITTANARQFEIEGT